MLTIESVMKQLRENYYTVPQPEGSEVAEAYRSGIMTHESDMLHVVAVLLAEARKAEAVQA